MDGDENGLHIDDSFLVEGRGSTLHTPSSPKRRWTNEETLGDQRAL